MNVLITNWFDIQLALIPIPDSSDFGCCLKSELENTEQNTVYSYRPRDGVTGDRDTGDNIFGDIGDRVTGDHGPFGTIPLRDHQHYNSIK